MAISVSTTNVTANKTSGSSNSVNSGISASVGDVVVVSVSNDLTSGDRFTSGTFSDDQSNSWTKAYVNDTSTGCSVVWYTTVTTALSSTDQFTASVNTGSGSYWAWCIYVLSGAASAPTDASSWVNTTGNPSTANTIADSTSAALGFTFIHRRGSGLTGDTDTTNGSWSTFSYTETSGGSPTANIGCGLQYKLPTASGTQTWDTDQLGTGADMHQILVEWASAPSGPPVVNGTAALTSETSLTASATDTVIATAALSAQTSLTPNNTVTTTSTAALTSETNLTASGATVVSGTCALSSETSLTATGIVTVVVTLSSETTLTAVAQNSTFASAALTSETSLTPNNIVTTTGVASLTSETSLTAVGQPVKSGSAGLSAETTLLAYGAHYAPPGGSVTRGSKTIAEKNDANTSLACNVPTGLSDGDVLVAFMCAATGTITNPSGWSTIQSNLGTNTVVYMAYHIVTTASSEPSSYTWTGLDTGRCTIMVSAFSGVDTADVWDSVTPTTGTNTGTGSTVTMASLTTTTDNDMIVSVCGGNGSTAITWTQPSGFTLVDQSTGTGKGAACAADLVIATAGATGTKDWTWDKTNLEMLAIMGPLKPTTGGAAPVFGFASLSAQASLTASYAQGQVGSATLTAESSLVTSEVVTVIATAALTSETSLTANNTVTTTSTASMAGDSTLTVSGTVVKSGTAALTSETSLTAIPAVTVLANSALSSETDLTATNTVTVISTVTLTSESNLTAIAAGQQTGSAALTSESTLTAIPNVTVIASSPLSSETSLTSIGQNTVLAISTLSSETTLAETVLITVLANSALSSETTLTANNIVSTTGVATLSAQSTLTAVGQVPTGTIVSIWTGHVTTTTVRVISHVTNATSGRLKVSTAADLSVSPIYSSSDTADTDGYIDMTCTGLSANQQYYYGIELDGNIDGQVGAFKTAPSGAANFSFAFASCNLIDQDSVAWSNIETRAPEFIISTGDMPYIDVTTDNQSAIRSARETFAALTKPASAMSKAPLYYTWSDHDFGGNNAVGSSASKPAQQAVYRQMVPSPSLVDSNDIYYSFSYGRIKFIVTDNRSNKSSNSATDDSNKTVLGATQKTWFKNEIDNATEPLIFWVNEQPWIGTPASPDDEWFAYSTERAELGNYVANSGKHMIILSGDMHALAADDGTNSVGNIPVLHAAPFANLFSNKGGPYSEGVYPTSGSGNIYQYGWVDITDTGSTVTMAFTGYDSSDTSQITLTLTYVFGTAALTAQSTLTAIGTVPAVTGTAALTSESTLTATATVTELATAALTSETSLTANNTVTTTGTAALTSESNLSAIGTITRLGVATLTSETSLAANNTVTTTSTAALTSETSLTAIPSVTVSATAALTSQASLTSTPVVNVLDTAALTSETSLTAIPTVTVIATAALTSETDVSIVVFGDKVGSADLTSETSLTAIAQNEVFATSALTANSSITANNTVETTSTAALTSESTLVIIGQNNVYSVVSLSSESTLVESDLVTVLDSSPLSGITTLTASGTMSTSGTAALSSETTVIAIGSTGYTPGAFAAFF